MGYLRIGDDCAKQAYFVINRLELLVASPMSGREEGKVELMLMANDKINDSFIIKLPLKVIQEFEELGY